MLFDRLITFLLGSLLVLLGLASLVGTLAYMPRALYVESKCLESGYPKSAVDWKLRGYCMNLEGTVTVSVQRVGE